MLGDPAQIIPGIRTIILMEDALITDYIQIAASPRPLSTPPW